MQICPFQTPRFWPLNTILDYNEPGLLRKTADTSFDAGNVQDEPEISYHTRKQRKLSKTTCCCCLVAKLYPFFCDPVDCSPPGSSVNGILQARILVWVPISFSRGSSRPRDRTHVSWIGRWTFCYWAIRETPSKTIRVGPRTPWRDFYWQRWDNLNIFKKKVWD